MIQISASPRIPHVALHMPNSAPQPCATRRSVAQMRRCSEVVSRSLGDPKQLFHCKYMYTYMHATKNVYIYIYTYAQTWFWCTWKEWRNHLWTSCEYIYIYLYIHKYLNKKIKKNIYKYTSPGVILRKNARTCASHMAHRLRQTARHQ
jgi:hypothetical protein